MADQGAQVDAGYIFFFSDCGDAYEDWARENFGDVEVENPALEASFWGSDADPDKDGVVNALEAWMNLDPLASDSAASLTSVHHEADGDLVFRYRKGKESHGGVGRVKWSRDLMTWSGGENGQIDEFEFTTRVFDEAPDHFIMETRISGDQLVGESKLFLRLEVNVP